MRRLVLAGLAACGLWAGGCERGGGQQGGEAVSNSVTPQKEPDALHRAGNVPNASELPGTGGGGTVGGQAPAGSGAEACGPAAQQGAAQASKSVTGRVRSATRQTLTLEQEGGRLLELRTDASTCVLQAGRAVAPEALREGTEVRAGYSVNASGEPVARRVEAQANSGSEPQPGQRSGNPRSSGQPQQRPR